MRPLINTASPNACSWRWRDNYCFHGWLPEVKRGLARLVENGIDLSQPHLNFFNISLVQGKI